MIRFKFVPMFSCRVWILFGVSQFTQCLLSLPHHIPFNIVESFWSYLIHWAKPKGIYEGTLPQWNSKPCLRRASKRRARAPREVWLSRLPCKKWSMKLDQARGSMHGLGDGSGLKPGTTLAVGFWLSQIPGLWQLYLQTCLIYRQTCLTDMLDLHWCAKLLTFAKTGAHD